MNEQHNFNFFAISFSSLLKYLCQQLNRENFFHQDTQECATLRDMIFGNYVQCCTT